MKREQLGVKAWEATVRKTQAAAKKRVSGFFTSTPVSQSDDEEGNGTPVTNSNNASDTYHAERFLSNGDFYTGQLSDNYPHGTGKYLWIDGCMYMGEWFRGKTMGRGKFSWPSGATYEGEFKTGYMDGKGTYTSPAGDTYRGSWVMNLKHGQGIKHYSNGDLYDGEWRRGSQDGNGRYQWKDGAHYVGKWKNGAISGTGSFIWSNGNRYDGSWDDGVPKGNGTYRWADGSFYVGVWSKDPSEQSGTFYPSPTGTTDGDPDWDPQELYNELSDYTVCPTEKITILPSQKVINWSATEVDLLQKQGGGWRVSKGGDSSGNPRRNSVDGRGMPSSTSESPYGRMSASDIELIMRNSVDGSSMFMREGDNFLEDGESGGRMSNFTGMLPKEMKKQGATISKGHKNYELMLNLQLGIRHSVGRPAPLTSLDLKASAFDPKEKVWTKFPPEGTKYTPPHISCDFRWKDYCPLVFRTLRKLFRVDPADYMLSICGNDALRELSSPGKSGSFFYLTNDDRYMIKTMKKSEVKVLIRMLPAYYNHVRAFENTLVTKFFGLHCVKLTGATQKKVRFVIMGNLFCTQYTIHRRFDLKGSSHGRTTAEGQIDETTTLKDLDLNFIFRLQKSWFQEFQRQVDRDCELLEQERIMDYSLLVGLHFIDANRDPLLTEGSSSGLRTPKGEPEVEIDADQLLSDPNRYASIKLGINMPARVEQTVRRSDCDSQLIGEPTGEFYDVIVFFGIIDILQDYDISKKLEHAYKSIQYDPTSISAVDPKQYSKRFRDFIYKIFTEDT
ncbi:hypothetical protein MKW98_011201 [Papaver atlanticum]|uniref:Phosphatidylinositol 4-phosphate 5-kinase n=1 Tax=Papaver atlanticum TaxID=357466 RepID=A0AAD4X8D5_9MAGN|nr:hypothetical protein MKW98_011201 [Papaver atlanticum]